MCHKYRILQCKGFEWSWEHCHSILQSGNEICKSRAEMNFMGRGSRDREATSITSITSIGITFCESNTRCIDATNEGTRDEGHSSLKFEGRSQTHNGEDVVDETKVGGASLHFVYLHVPLSAT